MSNYIHGTDPPEQARLTALNELINDRCLRMLTISPGDHILDIGSGLGQFTLAMALKTGANGRCLGIERDNNQLAIANRCLKESPITWASFRQGHVEDLLLADNEWGSFDLVHARFLLEHVSRPESVVQGMCRAARSGGKVVLADDDHAQMKLYPPSPGFDAVWNAYMHSYERLGNDPLVGRRLSALLHQQGLSNIRTDVIFFGDCSGSLTFSAYVNNLVGILTGSRDLIVKESLMKAADFDESIRHLRQWGQRTDAAIWYVINWAEGTKS